MLTKIIKIKSLNWTILYFSNFESNSKNSFSTQKSTIWGKIPLPTRKSALRRKISFTTRKSITSDDFFFKGRVQYFSISSETTLDRNSNSFASFSWRFELVLPPFHLFPVTGSARKKNYTLTLKIIGCERKCHFFTFFVALIEIWLQNPIERIISGIIPRFNDWIRHI